MTFYIFHCVCVLLVSSWFFFSSFATLSRVNELLTLMRVYSSNTHAVGSEGKTVYCKDRNRECNMLGQHTVIVHYYEANWFVLSESYTLLPLASPNLILRCYFHHQAPMHLSAFHVVDNRIYRIYGSMANPSINQPVIILLIQAHEKKMLSDWNLGNL